MRAMILAAGRGSRMRHLTQETPKPLLPLGDCTLIEHHLYRLAQASIQTCVINLHYLGEKIAAFLGDGSRYGLCLQYSYEADKIETGGGVIQALPLLGPEPFLLMSGDIYTDFPLASLQLDKGSLAHLVMTPNPNHHPKGDFVLQEDGLLALPSEGSETTLTYGNIGLYHPDLFKPHPPGYRKLAEILRTGIDQQTIQGTCYQGTWMNLDTPDRLMLARKHLHG